MRPPEGRPITLAPSVQSACVAFEVVVELPDQMKFCVSEEVAARVVTALASPSSVVVIEEPVVRPPTEPRSSK